MYALKIFRKTNKLTLLRMRVYQGVRNSSFWKIPFWPGPNSITLNPFHDTGHIQTSSFSCFQGIYKKMSCNEWHAVTEYYLSFFVIY